jgi:hypothetical protein
MAPDGMRIPGVLRSSAYAALRVGRERGWNGRSKAATCRRYR